MTPPSPHSPDRRVRCVILGGGLHGAGLLRELTLHGWRDVVLVEPGTIDAPLCAEHPWLVHAGLRDCLHLAGVPFSRECATERVAWGRRTGDHARRCRTSFPASRQDLRAALRLALATAVFRLTNGLTTRRRVAGIDWIPDASTKMLADRPLFTAWCDDLVVDDRHLARRLIDAATRHGASLIENETPSELRRTSDGWEITLARPDGSRHIISTLHIANFMGPLSRELFERAQIKPTHHAIDGGFLCFPVIGHEIEQSLTFRDETTGQPVTVIPTPGQTFVVGRLVGREREFLGDPPGEARATALLERLNQRFKTPWVMRSTDAVTWRHYWFASAHAAPRQSLTRHPIARQAIVGEHQSARGLMTTLYGGPPETYRRVASRVARRLVEHFGDVANSDDRDSLFL